MGQDEKLLALIAEAAEEDEDILVKFADASWSGTSLALQLSVSVGCSSTTWEVRCEEVLAYLLGSENADWLEMIEDHPLLGEYKDETASAFFYSSPVNPDAALGALYEAHQNAVGNWIRFGQHLNNPLDLSKLLAAGNGLLAEGPLPLLTLYQETLAALWRGTRYSFCASTPNMGRNPVATSGPTEY